MITSDKVISTILKHDAKVTSYKIALLRAINDVVLSFPDLRTYNKPIAIPLRMLSEFWVAYYWPFVEPGNTIMQGPRSKVGTTIKNDMAFRPYLTDFYLEWSKICGASRPSDGFIIINELRVPRKRASYEKLLSTYDRALKEISKTIEMPIRYAGPSGEQWTVFEKPIRYGQLLDRAIPIPGTQYGELCLVIRPELWQAFREMSLWIEALSIHEWCLFTEKVVQEGGRSVDRGAIYRLLTDRPDNRRPLTWERDNIDLLINEGKEFICPWTERRIRSQVAYEIDHVLPVSESTSYGTLSPLTLTSIPMSSEIACHQSSDYSVQSRTWRWHTRITSTQINWQRLSRRMLQFDSRGSEGKNLPRLLRVLWSILLPR